MLYLQVLVNEKRFAVINLYKTSKNIKNIIFINDFSKITLSFFCA